MKIVIATFLMLVSVAVQAQILKSAAWRGENMGCGAAIYGPDLQPLDGSGHWDTQNATVGAGTWAPGQNMLVRRVCVTHGGAFSGDSYAVSGHSGANTVDHATPYVIGMGSACTDYAPDKPLIVTGGEYFDIHAQCSTGYQWVALQIWWYQP